MARIDDYKQAKKIAVESLKKIETEEIAQRGGYQLSEGPAMIVPFLDRKYRIDGGTFEFADIDDQSKEVPIQEQVLILHYLDGELFPQPSGKMGRLPGNSRRDLLRQLVSKTRRGPCEKRVRQKCGRVQESGGSS